MYNEDDFDENNLDHSINFQTWFFENGIIELRFGEMDLENCTYYFPGEGFSFDNTDPTDNIYGPWVSINNDDFSEGACFFNDHTDPDILYDQDDFCGVLTSIPPAGFVVRFRPAEIMSVTGQFSETPPFKLQQDPGQISIKGDLSEFISLDIYDITGRHILHTASTTVPFSGHPNQLYICHIESRQGVEVHKFLVQR